MPKVSIIIPVYNAQDYLERCLDSVINQTLKDIEIICINDCSKDSSLDILKKYSAYDDRIKVLDNKSNLGESKTRNRGISYAKGEYIAFLDNDDRVDLDFYEKLYEGAKQEDADIAKADVKIYDYSHKNLLTGWSVNENIKEYNDKMYFSLYWWTAIYRTQIIKENKIVLPEDMILGGDIVFLNKAVIKANRVVVVDDTYYHWLRRENSGDSKLLNDEKVSSVLKAYKLVLESMNNISDDIFKENSYIFVYNMFMCGIFHTAFRNDSNTNKEKCIDLIFEMYEKCRLKEKFDDIYLNKYPSLKRYLKNGDKQAFFDLMIQNSSEEKLMFHELRAKIKNGAG